MKNKNLAEQKLMGMISIILGIVVSILIDIPVYLVLVPIGGLLLLMNTGILVGNCEYEEED